MAWMAFLSVLLLVSSGVAQEFAAPAAVLELIAQMKHERPQPTFASERFKRLDEVRPEERPHGWDAARGSIGRTYVRGSAGNCTATRVSPEGHVLTAFHCVSWCVWHISTQGVRNNSHFVSRFDESRLPVDCESKGGEHYGEPIGLWNARYRLIAVGSNGYLDGGGAENLPYSDNDQYLKLRAEGVSAYGDVDDFALLQEVGADGDAPFMKPSCADELPAGERLWSISHPSSPTLEPMFTSGRALSSMEETAIMGVVGKRLTPTQAAATFFDPRFMLSTLDARSVSSGSAVLDSRGEVVGVTVFKIAKDQSDYVYGSHGAVTMKHIRTVMKAKLAPDVFKTVFGCK